MIIWKIFLPRITYSIENRKSRVVNDLDEAQKLKENAEKKLKEYNEIIEKSKKEAKKILGLKNPRKNYGGAMENRTPDLRIANATLYQLSYDPTHANAADPRCEGRA